MESNLHFIADSYTFTMAADYFDTPSRDLKKAGLTLRLRRENDLSVCCLKYRVSDTARFEAEEVSASIEDGIAKLSARQDLSENIKNILQKAQVVPLYSSSFKRVSRLAKEGKSVIELSYDCGYLAQQDRFLPISEVELELKDGTEEDLQNLAQRLCAEYNLSIFRQSKAQRASGLTEEAFTKMTPTPINNPSPDLLYSGKIFIRKKDNSLIYYLKNEE